MSRDYDDILAAAATWHAASANDDMDWDGFTTWLEADACHRSAYDEIALADAALGDHLPALQEAGPAAANDDPAAETVPVTRRGFSAWMAWAGVAIAASLAALLVVPQFLEPAAAIYGTGATSRRIALADGSSITLAPHSQLTVEGRQQDRMALAGGAWFDIRHDPARSLQVSANGLVISDIGTRFDVQAAAGQVRVEVAEGTVKVASDALSEPIRLTQNRSLLYDGQGGTAVVSHVTDENIGEWRAGRLSYESMPLSLVAADLSRYAGVDVTVADAVRDRQFSGTLVIGDGKKALRDLAQVMGLELDGGAGRFRLEQHSR